MLSFISYNPIVEISLGPLSISPHGVGIAVGFLMGARLMLPTAREKGIDEEEVVTVLMWAALGALIGARLAYVINHFGDYTDDPVAVLKVWEGGISLLGGIFGAILLAMPQMKKRGMHFWRTMDAAAPGIALGIIIGRIGDLIVADHLGKETDFFLGYECPGVRTASPCIGEAVHQTALYDLVLTSLLLVVLLILRRKPRYDGFLIIFFGAWYGTGRIIEDFLREDLRRLGLTGSQWTALATLVICIVWLTLVRRTPRWGHWSTREPGPVDSPDEPILTDSPDEAVLVDSPDEPVLTDSPDEAHTMTEPPEAGRLDREEL